MGREEDEAEEFGEKLVAPADFAGPTEERHCTDVLCLGMLLASWVVMTVIGIYSISNGDYRLVLYPLDYDGNICGTGMSTLCIESFVQKTEEGRGHRLCCYGIGRSSL